jgi:hypothetical protein
MAAENVVDLGVYRAHRARAKSAALAAELGMRPCMWTVVWVPVWMFIAPAAAFRAVHA